VEEHVSVPRKLCDGSRLAPVDEYIAIW
jgi:hypothetical protein